MDNFDKAEELLEFATESYTLLYALEKLNLESINDQPNYSLEEKKMLRDLVSRDLVNEIFVQPNTREVIYVATDKAIEESPYCLCKLITGGDMVYCCNTDCPRGSWFHLECLRLEQDDVTDNEWYCSENVKSKSLKQKGKPPKL